MMTHFSALPSLVRSLAGYPEKASCCVMRAQCVMTDVDEDEDGRVMMETKE